MFIPSGRRLVCQIRQCWYPMCSLLTSNSVCLSVTDLLLREVSGDTCGDPMAHCSHGDGSILESFNFKITVAAHSNFSWVLTCFWPYYCSGLMAICLLSKRLQPNPKVHEIHFNVEMKVHLLLVWRNKEIIRTKFFFYIPVNFQVVYHKANILSIFFLARVRMFKPESSAAPIQNCLLGTVGKYSNYILNWYKWQHTSHGDILKLVLWRGKYNTVKQRFLTLDGLTHTLCLFVWDPPKHSNNGPVLC